MNDAGPGRPRRVVIVGGGFGGLAAARGPRRSSVEVTLYRYRGDWQRSVLKRCREFPCAAWLRADGIPARV